MSNDSSRFSEARLKKLAALKIEENARERDASAPKLGVPVNFSVEVHELMMRKESDPASAMRLLEIFAKDLRAGVLSNPLIANYVANAIELAASQPLEAHSRALTDGLHLTSKNRRPAQAWLEVGHAMDRLIRCGVSQNKAKLTVAVDHGIDERTALNCYQKYVAADEYGEHQLPVNRPDTA